MNPGQRRKRKQYLYSNVPVPRSTEYSRRKREERQAELFLASSASARENSITHAAGETVSVQVDRDIVDTAFKSSANCSTVPEKSFDDSGHEETAVDTGVPEYSHAEIDNISDSAEESELNLPLHSSELHSDNDGVPALLSDDESEKISDNEEERTQDRTEGQVFMHEDGQNIDFEDELEDQGLPNNRAPELATALNELTSTTEGDALLMCLALGFRHSLSWTAIVDILSMINGLFDREVVKASKYFFLKYMESAGEKIAFHVYCPNCERYLGTKRDLSMNDLRGCHCGTEIKDINEASTFFLSLNLEDQIQGLLKDEKFVESLSYRFRREKLDDEAYEDIYDGKVYRRLSAPGEVLCKRYKMSYTFNTDGCPIGKSSKQTCWPFYVQINELPRRLRSKYMMLAGIYVGRKDPNMKIFMHPFVEEANDLATRGVSWVLNGKEMNSKIIPLCACVDSVARCKLLNMTQFNGWFGCTLCHYQAELCSKNGLRYTITLNGFHERTHESILLDSVKAHNNMRTVRNRNKRSVRGCKGPTPIHNMLYLDLVRGVRPDPMHSMMLGNSRHHTFLLAESSGQRYYIGSDVRLSAISSRLLSIKPPSSVMRTPRGLKEMSLWKASEWRSWIVFYGVVCLYGIIPDEFVSHFSMLSSALHIVLQKSISPEKLETAHILLLRYVFLYQQYFGKNAMVYNVHLLLHVKRSIECVGPAWTHCAFGFEGANKYLLQLKKGASSVAQEMARKFLTFKSLPTLCEKYASSDKAVEFCELLSGRSLKCYYRLGKTVLVGKGNTECFTLEETDVLESLGYAYLREAVCFGRFIHDGVRYTTAYQKSTKTDDSHIAFHAGVRARIQKICRLPWQNEYCVVLVRIIQIKEGSLFSDEFGSRSPIKEVEGDGQLCAIRPHQIEGQCVAMYLDNGNFICDMLFGCYGDS